MSCSLLGDGVRGVCPCGNGKCKDFAATPVVACVQMGEASKTRNATTKARRSTLEDFSQFSNPAAFSRLQACAQSFAEARSVPQSRKLRDFLPCEILFGPGVQQELKCRAENSISFGSFLRAETFFGQRLGLGCRV